MELIEKCLGISGRLVLYNPPPCSISWKIILSSKLLRIMWYSIISGKEEVVFFFFTHTKKKHIHCYFIKIKCYFNIKKRFIRSECLISP
jgi:hypothetical protein